MRPKLLALALVLTVALDAGIEAQRAASPPAGGVVSGVVRVAAQGPPAAHALVLIAGTDVGVLRVTSTDASGHFAFAALPPGNFLLAAGKPSYLAALYGASRAGRPATPITLRAGRNVTDVRLALIRGGVIAGRVLDAGGQPIVGARVRVLPRREIGDEMTLGADAGSPTNAMTDDRGAYRAFDLPPGDYVVALQPRGLNGVPSAYAPMYFPAAARPAEAGILHIDVGTERTDVDLHASIVPLFRVAGVVNRAGGPSPNLQVQLHPGGQMASGIVLGSQTSRPGPDGRFAFPNVPPGEYDLVARAVPPPAPPDEMREPPPARWATARVVVTAAPVEDIRLDLKPALSISGRLTFDGQTTPPEDVNFRVGVRPTPGSGVPGALQPVAVDKDGRFTIGNLTPGRYRLYVLVPPNNVTQVPDWFARSASVDGHDALDVPFMLDGETTRSDIAIAMTDDAPEIAGTVRDESGQPVRGATLIAFPVDRALRFPQSRRIVVRQSGAAGAFVFGIAAGLPPGDYYVAALADLGPNEQFDSALLDELARGATRVTLMAGDSKTIDVRRSQK